MARLLWRVEGPVSILRLVLKGVKDIEKREGKYSQKGVESASLTFVNSMSDMNATLQVQMSVRGGGQRYGRAFRLLQQ